MSKALIHEFFFAKFGFFNIYLNSQSGNKILVKCLNFSVSGIRILSVNKAILQNEVFSICIRDKESVPSTRAKVITVQKIVFRKKVYYFVNLKFLEISNFAVEEISNYFYLQAKLKFHIFREKNSIFLYAIFVMTIACASALFIFLGRHK